MHISIVSRHSAEIGMNKRSTYVNLDEYSMDCVFNGAINNFQTDTNSFHWLLCIDNYSIKIQVYFYLYIIDKNLKNFIILSIRVYHNNRIYKYVQKIGSFKRNP